jgi:hypothetical protein
MILEVAVPRESVMGQLIHVTASLVVFRCNHRFRQSPGFCPVPWTFMVDGV